MKNEFKIMRIEVYECPECKEEFYSRAQHDFITCKCNKSSLDGGHINNGIWIPMRLIGSIIGGKRRIIKLEVTEKELYDDWNYSTDKYGRLK